MPNITEIATGVRAIGGAARRAYRPCELASELGVHVSSIYRWADRGLIRVDRTRGFALISADEARRFSREGPALDALKKGQRR